MNDPLLDSKDTLSEENVSACDIDVVVGWVSGVNHQTVDELHGLGTLTTQFTRHDNLNTLGAGFHDETKNTVAGSIIQNKINTQVRILIYEKFASEW